MDDPDGDVGAAARPAKGRGVTNTAWPTPDTPSASASGELLRAFAHASPLHDSVVIFRSLRGSADDGFVISRPTSGRPPRPTHHGGSHTPWDADDNQRWTMNKC